MVTSSKETVDQGLPRPETTKTRLIRLMELSLERNDEESKAHLKGLARLIFDGMGQGQVSSLSHPIYT
jgi:hypothetical protein